MEFVYVAVCDGAEWEDLIIYLTEEEAKAASVRRPQIRVEIFKRRSDGGYEPTYNYFVKGERFG